MRVGRWSVVAALAFAACATLGPKEHEDLRAVEACGGTPRLRSDIAVIMRQYRLSMPDTVLALEFHTERWAKGFAQLPRDAAVFLDRIGWRTEWWNRPMQATVSADDYPWLVEIRRCLAARGYRFAVERR